MPTWPADPNGSLLPILEASLEASKARHPSSQAAGDILTAADRCDVACGAAALYRVGKFDVADRPLAKTLDFCRHHFFENFPKMCATGNWKCTGSNPELLAVMGE